jgi:hypothetical protein
MNYSKIFWTDVNDRRISQGTFDACAVADDLPQHPLSRDSNPSDPGGAAAAGTKEIKDYLRTPSRRRSDALAAISIASEATFELDSQVHRLTKRREVRRHPARRNQDRLARYFC